MAKEKSSGETKGSKSEGIAGSIETLQNKTKTKLKDSPGLETIVMNYFEVLKKIHRC